MAAQFSMFLMLSHFENVGRESAIVLYKLVKPMQQTKHGNPYSIGLSGRKSASLLQCKKKIGENTLPPYIFHETFPHNILREFIQLE